MVSAMNNACALKATVGSYSSPTLIIYGSVSKLTANGSKPGNEQEINPGCVGNNGNPLGINNNHC